MSDEKKSLAAKDSEIKVGSIVRVTIGFCEGFIGRVARFGAGGLVDVEHYPNFV